MKILSTRRVVQDLVAVNGPFRRPGLAGSSRATPLGYQPLIRLCNIAADGALDCEGATGYRCVKW